MNETQALLTVLADGQATLYGKIVELQAELLKGEPIPTEIVAQWENEWKKQTSNLVQELMQNDSG